MAALDLVRDNLRSNTDRFPMVFTDSIDATPLLQYTGLVNPLVLIGSDFEADLTNAYDHMMLREVRTANCWRCCCCCCCAGAVVGGAARGCCCGVLC